MAINTVNIEITQLTGYYQKYYVGKNTNCTYYGEISEKEYDFYKGITAKKESDCYIFIHEGQELHLTEENYPSDKWGNEYSYENTYYTVCKTNWILFQDNTGNYYNDDLDIPFEYDLTEEDFYSWLLENWKDYDHLSLVEEIHPYCDWMQLVSNDLDVKSNNWKNLVKEFRKSLL